MHAQKALRVAITACARSASLNVLEKRPSETIADIAPDPGHCGVSDVSAEMQDSAQSPGNSESFCGVIAMPAKRSGDGPEGGGEGGIRTLGTLLTYTHFPGVLLQPLGHLSGAAEFI